jgi:nitrate/nitrite transporter NarK
MLKYIFFAWGITTVFTFWSALMKAVKLLASKDEEGKFFGALDGGRGLVEAALATVAVFLFAAVTGGDSTSMLSTKAGMQAVIFLYVGALLLLSVLNIIFLEKEEKIKEKVNKADAKIILKENIESIKQLLTNGKMWLMATIIFCGYTLTWTIFYFSGYLVVNHDATPIIAGYVTVGLLWMRPIGGIGGGVIADKIGRARLLSIAMLVASIFLFALVFSPKSLSVLIIFGFVLVVGLMCYLIRGVYWSLLESCKLPLSILGIAIGLVSFLGYLPDIIIPKMTGVIYASFGDNIAGGNNVYFIVSAVVGILGAILSYLFYHKIEKLVDLVEE